MVLALIFPLFHSGKEWKFSILQRLKGREKICGQLLREEEQKKLEEFLVNGVFYRKVEAGVDVSYEQG